MSAKFHQISLKVLLITAAGLRLSEGRLLKWKHGPENGVLLSLVQKAGKTGLYIFPKTVSRVTECIPRH